MLWCSFHSCFLCLEFWSSPIFLDLGVCSFITFGKLVGLFVCLWPHLWHMEIPRLGVESELQLRPMPQPHNTGSELDLGTTPCLAAMLDP